jgi:hypothetical protein
MCAEAAAVKRQEQALGGGNIRGDVRGKNGENVGFKRYSRWMRLHVLKFAVFMPY